MELELDEINQVLLMGNREQPLTSTAYYGTLAFRTVRLDKGGANGQENQNREQRRPTCAPVM